MLAGLVPVLLALALGACAVPEQDQRAAEAIESDPRNAGVALSIGTRQSTEQLILGEIYAQALSAAGYEAETAVALGSRGTVAAALREGEVDGLLEDIASALTSLSGLEPAGVPGNPRQAFDELQAGLEPLGLVASPPTPFSNANGVALLSERAEELGVSALSELEGISEEMVLAGPPGCLLAAKCLAPVEEEYGLGFGRIETVEPSRRFEVLDEGLADLSIVSSTDAELARSETYALLEDDRGAMPAGNVVLILSEDAVQRAGKDLEATIELAQKGLTDAVMRSLRARVEIDGEAPAGVVRQYLAEAGLVR
jgi:glycine betaine/choline ABC-type transport system substrate-binding protein